MGLFGSKTKYYVSSSTFPIFNREKRVEQFESAIVTYNSYPVYELSETLKKEDLHSLAFKYRAYLNWCERSGFDRVFGKSKTIFFSNPRIDNSTVTNAIKDSFVLGPNDKFQVYSTSLAFFSEDFFIKHLATQQGKAELIYKDSSITYTLEFPTDKTVKALFSNGEIIEGTLPTYTSKTRFLEICYSIVTTETIEPPTPPEGSEPTEPVEPTIKITTKYGYLQYQEGTGNSTLDTLIKNNGITRDTSFFPAIPIRNNTVWFQGEKRSYINSALRYIDCYDKGNAKDDCITQLEKSLVEGMKGGSINDIDYITLVPAIALFSDNQSDLRYLYEFFYNLYANEALSQGISPEDVGKAKYLEQKQGYLKKFFGKALDTYDSASRAIEYINNFTIENSNTNLHLSYEWDGAEYFEANGKFKASAKVGDYGMAVGRCNYTYTSWKQVLVDNEFRPIYRWESEEVPIEFDVNLFCHQYSKTRYRFTFFIGLGLRNLIYHGKSVYTYGSDVLDETVNEPAVFKFPKDILDGTGALPTSTGYAWWDKERPENIYPDFVEFELNFIKSTADSNCAFIVPLELSTFLESGYKTQLNLAYGSQYLVCNCWVKKKQKWYQSGFFGAILSIINIVIMIYFPVWGVVGQWIAGAFIVASAVFVTAFALQVLQTVLTGIFGEHLGMQIYSFLKSLVGVVCAFIATVVPYFGILIAMAIMFVTTAADALNQGSSLRDALVSGAREAIKTGLIAEVAGVAGKWASTTAKGYEALGSYATHIGNAAVGATSGFMGGILDGDSFKDAFVSGIIGGITAGVGSYLLEKAKAFLNTLDLFKTDSSKVSKATEVAKEAVNESASKSNKTFGDLMQDLFVDDILKNPATYEKLINMTQAEVYYHKLSNLENDYQEFNNKLAAATKTLYSLMDMNSSMVNADYIATLQANIGRYYTQFPEALVSLTPDTFFTSALSVGSDQIKNTLGAVTSLVDSKMTLNGYTPYRLHQTLTDYSLAWDAS